jgi:WD40 repeat protein
LRLVIAVLAVAQSGSAARRQVKQSQSTLQIYADVNGSLSHIDSLCMSSDGKTVACARPRGMIFVHRLDSNKPLKKYDLTGYQGPKSFSVPSMFLSSTGGTLAVAFGDGSTAVLSISTGKVIASHRSSLPPDLPLVQLVNHGQQVAIGTETGLVTILDVKDGNERWRWQLPIGRVTGGSISPDGEMLAIEQSDRNVALINRLARKVIRLVTGDLYGSFDRFSTDGRQFACADSEPGHALYWSSSHPRRLYPIESDAFTSSIDVAVSPDGHLIALSMQSEYTTIWGVDDNGHVQRDHYQLGHNSGNINTGQFPSTMAFSPDGRSLLVGYLDGSVVVWQFINGKHIRHDEVPSPHPDVRRFARQVCADFWYLHIRLEPDPFDY